MGIRATIMLMLAFIAAGEATAQGFPSKQIRLVATSAPGSVVDLFGRGMADQLAQATGQNVIVENRAGAGGTIAAAQVLQADADGHAILVNTSAQIIAPFVYPNLPFDMLREFYGIAMLAVLPNVVILPNNRPWRTVQELIAAAKAKPGAFTYATAGTGTGTHMSAERFRLAAKIDAVQVAYKASPEALVDVIAGRVDWSILPLSSVLTYVREGRVRAIALSGERRSPQLPDLPTLVEAGLTDGDFLFWTGLFVSTKTPAAVQRRLQELTVNVLQLPIVRERYAKLGAESSSIKAEQFDAFVKGQAEIAGAILKAANIRP